MIKFFKLLIALIYVISPTSTYSIDQLNLKNLVIHNIPKKLEKLEFKNVHDETIDISYFKNKLVLLNFWATWCSPCRDEMPSLDKLAVNKDLESLKIIPINIGRESIENAENFFKEINVQNLEIYYDQSLNLPKKLLLRGIPTTVLINKNGEEFARIIGEVDFEDKQLIEWLKKYN